MKEWLQFANKWLRLGALGFGGPGVQISFMLDQCVKRERAVSEETFSEGLAIASALPGPEAQQLATFLGFKEKGFFGGIVSGSCFVLPGLILITGAAIVIHHLEKSAVSLLYPLRVAATSLIFYSVSLLARRQFQNQAAWILFFTSIAALLLGLSMSQVIFGSLFLAGFCIFKINEVKPSWKESPNSQIAQENHNSKNVDFKNVVSRFRPRVISAMGTLVISMIVLYLSLGGNFKAVAFESIKATLLSFGGAYAALPILGEAAVKYLGRPDIFYSGIALAELLPGPLMLVSSWLGALMCASESQPVSFAILGSITAAVFTYLPGMLLMMSFSQLLMNSRKILEAVRQFILPVALAGMTLIGFRLIKNISQDWIFIHPALLVSFFLVLIALGVSTLRIVGIALGLSFLLYAHSITL